MLAWDYFFGYIPQLMSDHFSDGVCSHSDIALASTPRNSTKEPSANFELCTLCFKVKDLSSKYKVQRLLGSVVSQRTTKLRNYFLSCGVAFDLLNDRTYRGSQIAIRRQLQIFFVRRQSFFIVLRSLVCCAKHLIDYRLGIIKLINSFPEFRDGFHILTLLL